LPLVRVTISCILLLVEIQKVLKEEEEMAGKEGRREGRGKKGRRRQLEDVTLTAKGTRRPVTQNLVVVVFLSLWGQGSLANYVWKTAAICFSSGLNAKR